MLFGIVITVSVVSAIVLAVGLFLQRGRESLDLSPRGLLRPYLYVASLAGVIATAGGLAALLTFGLAGAIGRDAIYGGQGIFREPVPVTKCPQGAVDCTPSLTTEEQKQRLVQQQDRQAGEDLIRGISFTVFGALFFGAHWLARRALAIDEGGSMLRRGYLMIGTLAFGLAAIFLLPEGVTNALSNRLLTAAPESYRQPAGEGLAGGIVALVVWLVYLRLVIRDFRRPAA